ncbi:MAG: NAD(P)-dependent oxidoreductase [Cyanobacteria bacterium P01_D01_bin.73]
MLKNSSSPARYLVTGCSGFLGWNLCRWLVENRGDRSTIFGTYNRQSIDIPQVQTLPLDLTDETAITETLNQIKPTAVFHLAAAARPNWCQTNPDISHRVNVAATLNLATQCADQDIDFVFTSTDLVFDGLRGNYSEEDAVSPVCLYGEQKVAAELGIRDRHPIAKICRMPLMFGNTPPTAASFLQGFIEKLRSPDDPLFAFTDEFRTPASAQDAAAGLVLALESNVEPVDGRRCLHLGGAERLSRYDFAKKLAIALDTSPDRVQPGLQAQLTMPAPRSPDTSLNSQRAAHLGYQPAAVEHRLKTIVGALKN